AVGRRRDLWKPEKTKPSHWLGSVLKSGAQEKTRTSTVLPPLGPEPSASTNSATWAHCDDRSPTFCSIHRFGRYGSCSVKSETEPSARFLKSGAQEKTRTSTVLPPLGPEPSASTNSATWALEAMIAQSLQRHNVSATLWPRTIRMRFLLVNP